MGATTVYHWAAEDGLQGVPKPKTRDVTLHGQAGMYAPPDYVGARTVLVTLVIGEDDDAATFDAVETLNTVWAASTVDIPLYFRLPGWGKRYLVGRPRGLDVNMIGKHAVGCVGEFFAADPTIH